VHAAVDVLLGREVAAKVCYPGAMSMSPYRLVLEDQQD
jgi:hypothetical protein